MEALEIAQTASADPKLIWTFYHEIALDFYWLNLSDSALEFEKEALRLAKESDWPFIVVRSYTQLGIIFERRHEYDEAIQSGVRALKEGQKIDGEKSRLNIVSHALMRLGHLYRQAGNFSDAIANYDNALRMFEQLDLGMFLYEAHKGKFMALVGLGDNSAAGEELTETLRLLEQYRPKIQEERNRDLFFDVGQDTYDLAIDFAYSKLNNPGRAFEYAEQSRARSLLDLTHATTERVDASEGSKSNHSSPAVPRGLYTIQQSLPERVRIVQYSVLADKLVIWVVSRTGIESRALPISADDLQQKTIAYVKLIATDGSAEETAKAGRELHAILISPIEPLLNEKKELCIVPDKSLANLPYGSLVSPESGRFFVEKYTFVFSPSSNIFITCTEAALKKSATVRERILSVGNPTFAHRQFPELPDLPAAERERGWWTVRSHPVPVITTRNRSSARTRKRARFELHCPVPM